MTQDQTKTTKKQAPKTNKVIEGEAATISQETQAAPQQQGPMTAPQLLAQFANLAQSGELSKVLVVGMTKEGSVISAGSYGLSVQEGVFMTELTKSQLINNAITATPNANG